MRVFHLLISIILLSLFLFSCTVREKQFPEITDIDYLTLKQNMSHIDRVQKETGCFDSYFFSKEDEKFKFRRREVLLTGEDIVDCLNKKSSADSLFISIQKLNEYKIGRTGKISFLSNMVFIKGDLEGHPLNTHDYELDYYYIKKEAKDTMLSRSYFKIIAKYRDLVIMKP